jgi:branched-chain amino acid transport system ATP-binding protein
MAPPIVRTERLTSYQITNIFPHLSMHENVRVAAQTYRPSFNFWGRAAAVGGVRNKAGAILKQVGLWDKRELLAARLCEQQMLAIARGLVARPRLMLVDEPTEGLSPLLVENLTEILGEINRRGTTILLVEQMLEVALALSHRLYVMDQGRIQFEGTLDALRADPEIQQRFLGV